MLSTSGKFGLAIVAAVLVTSVLASAIAPGDPFATSDAVLQPPSVHRVFGSDDVGRDLFRAVVHGARVSLIVAVCTAVVGMAIGVLIGAAGGYLGGAADDVLMRLTELFQVIPRFFLVLAAAAVFGSSIGTLILILGLTSWPGIARMVRSQVMSIRTLDHVTAAHAAGASVERVMRRHVLPLALPAVMAQASFQASGAILVEAGVSFLGLGDPSVMTWGALLHEGQHFLYAAWWMALFPGLALTITVLGIHLIGDALGDATARGDDLARMMEGRC